MSKINILLALAVLTVFSCKKNEDATPTPTPSNTATVTYKLVSGTNCTVSWRQNGVDSMLSNVVAPWTKSFTDTIGKILFISAINTSASSNYVTVRISSSRGSINEQGVTLPVNGVVSLQDTL